VPIASSTPQREGRTAEQIAALSKALQETARVPSYGLLNARIAFELNDTGLEIALYARNITKKQYFTRLLPLEGTALGLTSYMPGDPQTYGVSATVRF
jgi:iron complex outermembrane receptor protein